MLYKNIDSKNGFTLIEIIASITLLSIILIIFIPAFPKIMKGSIDTEHEMVAGNLLSTVVHDLQEASQNETTTFAKYLTRTTNMKRCRTPETVPPHDLPKEGRYQVAGETFTTNIALCQEEDERDIGLVRAQIEIISSDEKVLTHSYTYIPEDGGRN